MDNLELENLNQEVTEPEVTEPEPIILPELLQNFLIIYPEFTEIFKDENSINRVLAIVEQLKCLYPEFSDLEKCYNKQPFFMLLAHYIVMSGLANEIGIFAQNGLVASSSIDGVSVSYQGSPYSSDELTYFLSLTPYGMAYLAWLRRQAGLRIIN